MGAAARIIQPTPAEVIEISAKRHPFTRRSRAAQQNRDRIKRKAGVAGPAPPFTPASITTATARAWHRADQGITMGVGVQDWADLFGNGYTVSQLTTTKQPTVSALASGGAPALRFTSASQQLLLLTSAPLATAFCGGTDTPYTRYIVFEAISAAAVSYPVTCGLSTSATSYVVTTLLTTRALNHQKRDGVGADVTNNSAISVVTLNTNYLLRVRHTGTAVTYLLNAVSVITAAASDVGNVSLDRFAIGAFVNTAVAGTGFFDGRIAESICYTGLVSAGEEAQLVTDYFQPRYAGVS